MDTSIASMTWYTKRPATHQKQKHRIELRRMKPQKVKDDRGKETTYTHGIWMQGEYVEWLTKQDAEWQLKNVTWDEIHRERL